MMKTSFLLRWLKTGIIITLFLVISPELKACESCNRSFLNTLLGEDKFNSLISKELRTAIAAQSGNGESPTKWVNDVLAMNNLTVADLSPAALNEIFADEPSPVSTPSYSNTANPADNQGLEFFDVMHRDKNLPLPATSYVPQNTKPDKYIRITLEEGDTYIGNGVIYKGFTIDKKIPGPTVIVEEGDVVSFTVVNEGNIPHGASIHAVYSQTSKYLGKIAPGDSATVVFQANSPGVYMYHCAPGGHAIPMHIIFGQYGMIVVEPKKKFELERILNKEPDIELYLVQHEYYASGKDAVDGQGKPMYTAFNGKLFRYVEEPIWANRVIMCGLIF
jgi:nitrite reductase (NO-forming)